jgi:hypothetical protein
MRLRRRRRRKGVVAFLEGALQRILAAGWMARSLFRGWRSAR